LRPRDRGAGPGHASRYRLTRRPERSSALARRGPTWRSRRLSGIALIIDSKRRRRRSASGGSSSLSMGTTSRSHAPSHHHTHVVVGHAAARHRCVCHRGLAVGAGVRGPLPRALPGARAVPGGALGRAALRLLARGRGRRRPVRRRRRQAGC
jgi:hypothetical protein